jgi:hypothetical protein
MRAESRRQKIPGDWRKLHKEVVASYFSLYIFRVIE